MTALVEWLRATGRFARATPMAVHDWRANDARAWRAAAALFAGLPEDAPPEAIDAAAAALFDQDSRPDDAR